MKSLKSFRSEALKRLANLSLLCLTVGLAACLCTSAEEIVLKNGTRIVARLAKINSDKLEIETFAWQDSSQPQGHPDHQLPGKQFWQSPKNSQ